MKSIPNTVIRFAKRETAPDLIFVHLLEPHMYGEDYTESVLEVLKHFQVKRYSLIGAMYDMVPHTRPLLVSGSGGGSTDPEESPIVQVRPSNYEGPTTITYLVTLLARDLGIDTRTFVVHLPQYFQVDEDFTGTAKLMEVLCGLYGLPDRLMDRPRGEQQYAALQNIVADASEVSSLLKRLEERYDREQQQEQTPPSPLSPKIEEFLRELGGDISSPE